ncbi:MAG TPA: MBL fold metallo-hydrolase [Candidatus Brocadiia bacterium]|nr:MBL fold metallo-hydrolase [Candidatus Brocadiales bacterium]
MNIIFMGTGTSHGVPMIACDCKVCTSDNPKNYRTRSSILISENSHNILIDAATEFRLQCIRNNVRRLDAVLLTHPHADHIFGLDDVRQFNWVQKEEIPVYGTEDTVKTVRNIFSYVFNDKHALGSKPRFSLNTLSGKLNLFNQEIIPIDVSHGSEMATGYRIGGFAYITDVSAIPESSIKKLKGLDVLVLGALRYTPHPKHFTIQQAVKIVQELHPKQTFLTHIAHEIEHEETNSALPEKVRLAYDGLEIKI